MPKFNVRVYGILINEHRILVTDEFVRGNYFTKFPGGGLEFGEGTRDCLKREFKEEANLDITVGEHIYTTDFFQISAFNNTHQIISIYYFVQPNNFFQLRNLQFKTQPFDFEYERITNFASSCEVFRWIDWNDFSENSVSLPIDKVVANLLKSHLKS